MKKIIALALAVLMLISAAAVAEKLVMGTNAFFPPYEYYDGDTIVGIDAEVAQAICDKLGYELEIQNMEFASLIAAVTSGKIDFSMAGMTVTDERKQSVDFSTSYATGIQAIIVTEDSPITSIDDIKAGTDWKIGVQQGTTGDLYMTWDFQDVGTGTVSAFNNGAEAVMALNAGKLDFVCIDNEPAKNFVAANTGLKLLDSAYTVEEYAIAMPKNGELNDAFNAALEELIADGTVASIIAKYIPAE